MSTWVAEDLIGYGDIVLARLNGVPNLPKVYQGVCG
jgi:hypothetical protein